MNGSSGGPLDVDDLPLSDLAYGLVASSARGTDLRQWASTILMLSDVQFIEAESADEDLLLKALWVASAEEPLDETVLEAAGRIAGE